MLKYLINRKSQILFAAIFCMFSANSFANDPSLSDKIRDMNAQEQTNEAPTGVIDSLKKVATDAVGLAKGVVEETFLADSIEKKLSKKIIRKKKLSSIMFSPKEESDINAALDSLRHGKEYLPEITEEEEEEVVEEVEEEFLNRKSYIHLASILYSQADDWTVWMNEEKISYDSNKPGNELFLESVTKDHVTVLWTISASKWRILVGRNSEEEEVNTNNQVEARFELHPNQTYLLVDDHVVEGAVGN